MTDRLTVQIILYWRLNGKENLHETFLSSILKFTFTPLNYVHYITVRRLFRNIEWHGYCY